jgi:hypothetical protein
MASAGLVMALTIAAFSFWRSRLASTNYYETHVYGMTAQSHRRYAIVSLVFAVLFALAYAIPLMPVFALLAVYVLVAIFYFSSFARGFSDEQ